MPDFTDRQELIIQKCRTNSLKGKTAVEIYGLEKANQLKQLRSISAKKFYQDNKERIKPLLQTHSGKSPWNKGLTKETNDSLKRIGEKNSILRLGHAPWNKGLKGVQIGWNKGKTGFKTQPCSEERKRKISLANTGKVRSASVKEKYSKAQKRLLEIDPNRRSYLLDLCEKALKTTKTKNTSIERKLQEYLKSHNIKFETHKRILNRTLPDIFIEPNICIYADGDYWHNLPETKEKDLSINEFLHQNGYSIFRLTETEINKKDFTKLTGVVNNA